MDANGGVEIGFGNAKFHGYTVSLSYFTSIRPQYMEPHDSVLNEEHNIRINYIKYCASISCRCSIHAHVQYVHKMQLSCSH